MREVAHWCFDDTYMQELGDRLLELAGTDVVSNGQATDTQKPCNHCLGNLFLKVLPDEVVFVG
jgi:hypothetical protein